MKIASTLVLSALFAAGGIFNASAQSVWTGGGGSTNTNWSSGTNWQSGTAPATGAALVFDTAANTASFNNTASGSFTYAGITFNAAAVAYTLSGNGIKLSGDIVDNNNSLIETLAFSNITFSNTNRKITVTTGGVLDVESGIQSTNGFTKTGNGTLILGGNNSYAGGTTISAGIVLANNTSGSATGTGNVTVTTGSTLGGSGFISPTTANTKITLTSSTLAPGTAGNTDTLTLASVVGNQTAGLLTLTNSTLNFNLGSGLASSKLSLTGAFSGEVVFSGATSFKFTDVSGGGLSLGQYTLIQTDSSTLSTAFAGLTLGTITLNGLPVGDVGDLEWNLVGGNYALQLNITSLAVPEPGMWLFMALSGGGLVALQARRQPKTAKVTA